MRTRRATATERRYASGNRDGAVHSGRAQGRLGLVRTAEVCGWSTRRDVLAVIRDEMAGRSTLRPGQNPRPSWAGRRRRDGVQLPSANLFKYARFEEW